MKVYIELVLHDEEKEASTQKFMNKKEHSSIG